MPSEFRLYCQARIGGTPSPECHRFLLVTEDRAEFKTSNANGPRQKERRWLCNWLLEGDQATCPACARLERAEGIESQKQHRRAKRKAKT